MEKALALLRYTGNRRGSADGRKAAMQSPVESTRRKHPLEDPVLRYLGEGVLEIDARGRVIRANPAAVELLWVPGGHLIGAPVTAVWGESANAMAAAFGRLTDPDAPEREVLEFNHRQRHLRLTLTRLSPTEGPPGFLAVVQDITLLKRRIEELDALNQVAAILNSTHDLKRVLELAIERIAAALHAEAASLLLRDDATGELVFEVAMGPVADRIRGRRLALGQGIAGWVARTGKSLLVPDVSADPRFSGGVDAASGFVTRSILCVPLKTSHGTLGVVQLLNHNAGRPFNEEDLRLLEAIALHAAAVIEQARLLTTLRQRIAELDALNHVATILNSTHDLQGVLELAIERVSAALHAEAGSLLLKDEATGELVFAVAVGPAANWLRGRRLAPGRGIAGWVAKTGEAILASNARHDWRFSDEMDKAVGFCTRSILSAPLKTSQEIIGVIELLNRVDGQPFTQTDLQLLETIGLHAAAVIEQAKLLKRKHELSALLAVSNVTEDFSGPVESLGSHLEDLFEAASQSNPNLVPTIEKAMERLENLRKLLRQLSRALPDHSPTPSPGSSAPTRS